MKILKYLLFLILIVIIGAAIYFATQDGSFDVSETKTINAPAEVVYNNVKDFKSWPQWGPWMEEDENMKIDYAEKTEGEGASYSWTSDAVGDGSMKTVKVIPNKEIEQEIIFNTPIGDSKSEVYWYFEDTETPGQTKVTWGMKGEQSFMEKVFMAFQEDDIETGLSKMFENGLNNLEDVVNESMEQYSINVDGITRYSGGYYMYNTTASKLSEISKKMGSMFGQVTGYMQQNNIQPSGMPFTIYNAMDQANGTVIFSAAVPVKDRVITPEGSPVLTGFMEPSTAVKTTLKGNYTNLSQAYKKAEQYIAENNLERDTNANMFEVYTNDPGEVPNPANWITEIYIPIQQKTKPKGL
ncbi:SRPBCC family protein [Marixanthomonas spongiae]|uniref:AraC family transcriptional regulator n=1 Tax=Marixanthomonas spongiae TaxID=2174845 RepID=A0A2U0I0A2_9FLAO|nr:SRPBCC family protein [Marixanthomonas spongiae]PVW14532.1 AraC family transcriptional regulator [Marixanthomonas spongiae]